MLLAVNDILALPAKDQFRCLCDRHPMVPNIGYVLQSVLRAFSDNQQWKDECLLYATKKKELYVVNQLLAAGAKPTEHCLLTAERSKERFVLHRLRQLYPEPKKATLLGSYFQFESNQTERLESTCIKAQKRMNTLRLALEPRKMRIRRARTCLLQLDEAEKHVKETESKVFLKFHVMLCYIIIFQMKGLPAEMMHLLTMPKPYLVPIQNTSTSELLARLREIRVSWLHTIPAIHNVACMQPLRAKLTLTVLLKAAEETLQKVSYAFEKGPLFSFYSPNIFFAYIKFRSSDEMSSQADSDAEKSEEEFEVEDLETEDLFKAKVKKANPSFFSILRSGIKDAVASLQSFFTSQLPSSKMLKRRRNELINCFANQRLLLVGQSGSGKSAVINSFNYVANLANPKAEFQEITKSRFANSQVTRNLIPCGPKTGMYKFLKEDQTYSEQASMGPTLYDTPGLPYRDGSTAFQLLLSGKFPMNSTALRHFTFYDDKKPNKIKDYTKKDPDNDHIPTGVLLVKNLKVPGLQMEFDAVEDLSEAIAKMNTGEFYVKAKIIAKQ